MGHPILQLAKTPSGSRAVRELRDYKVFSLGALRLASQTTTTTTKLNALRIRVFLFHSIIHLKLKR